MLLHKLFQILALALARAWPHQQVTVVCDRVAHMELHDVVQTRELALIADNLNVSQSVCNSGAYNKDRAMAQYSFIMTLNVEGRMGERESLIYTDA
jgi:hypothetical protein